MQIEITTDDNIEGSEELRGRVATAVTAALSRFNHQITRVEIHLGDDNAHKGGPADKRCMVEARPVGQQPVAVTSHASTVDEACQGALVKLTHLLDSRFGRLDDHKGGATIRRSEENREEPSR